MGAGGGGGGRTGGRSVLSWGRFAPCLLHPRTNWPLLSKVKKAGYKPAPHRHPRPPPNSSSRASSTRHALVGLADVLRATRSSAPGRLGSSKRGCGRGAPCAFRAEKGEAETLRAEQLDQCSAAASACCAGVITCQPAQFVEFVLRWQAFTPTRSGARRRIGGRTGSLTGLFLPRSCGKSGCCRRACRATRRAGWTSGWREAAASGWGRVGRRRAGAGGVSEPRDADAAVAARSRASCLR